MDVAFESGIWDVFLAVLHRPTDYADVCTESGCYIPRPV